MRKPKLTRCIPAVSLLSLSVTGCDTSDEPEDTATIEGQWRAVEVRGQDFPIANKEYSGYGEYQEYTGYSRTVASLTLYSGQSGYFDRLNTFITALSKTEVKTRRVYTAKVIEDLRPSYRIRLTRSEEFGTATVLNLNCTVAADTLSCDEEIDDPEVDNSWQFSRKG